MSDSRAQPHTIVSPTAHWRNGPDIGGPSVSLAGDNESETQSQYGDISCTTTNMQQDTRLCSAEMHLGINVMALCKPAIPAMVTVAMPKFIEHGPAFIVTFESTIGRA